jgi:hypothetical protein
LFGTYLPSTNIGSIAVSNTIECKFMPAQLAHSQMDLVVGLVDDYATGDGFGSLDFTITDNGDSIFSENFTSLTAADQFFSDNLLDLGSIGNGDQNGVQDLVFRWVDTSSVPGESFSTNLLFANAMVPEPANSLTIAAAALLMVAGRRGGKNLDRCAK